MHIPRKTLQFIGFNATGDLGHLTSYTSSRHATVWFDKAPPLEPASPWQLRHRDRFRLAARAWQALTAATRTLWARATTLAGLYISGYNLWIFWYVTHDRMKMHTIERQSGLHLLPL